MKTIPSLAQRNAQKKWSGKTPEQQKKAIEKRKKKALQK